MTETGFRSKFGGFNKDDVLEYINSLQQEHVREVEELRAEADAQREAYEKALNDANAELVRQFEELQTANAERERLQQLVSEQEEANRVLNERLGEESSAALKKQLAAQQAENTRLSEENRRYKELAQNYGTQFASISQKVAVLNELAREAERSVADIDDKASKAEKPAHFF